MNDVKVEILELVEEVTARKKVAKFLDTRDYGLNKIRINVLEDRIEKLTIRLEIEVIEVSRLDASMHIMRDNINENFNAGVANDTAIGRSDEDLLIEVNELVDENTIVVII